MKDIMLVMSSFIVRGGALEALETAIKEEITWGIASDGSVVVGPVENFVHVTTIYEKNLEKTRSTPVGVAMGFYENGEKVLEVEEEKLPVNVIIEWAENKA